MSKNNSAMVKVVLGYNSPTEWVFFPESLILYRPIVINKKIYDKVVSEGRSPSGYKKVKSQLVLELKDKGILYPVEYSVSESERENAKALFEWFVRNRGAELRGCAIAATRAFRKHETATFEKLISSDDPCYEDILELLPKLDRLERQLAGKNQLCEVDEFEKVFFPYFEEILFTPYPEDYNPVFTWDGYAQFTDLLLKQHFTPINALEGSLRKGTKQKVIRSIGEICLPFRPLRKPKELEKMLEISLELNDLRSLVEQENSKIWGQLQEASEIDKQYYSDFAKDFESFLQKRIHNLNEIIKSAKERIDKKRTKLTYKITRVFISTLCSILPGTGGLGCLLQDLTDKLLRDREQLERPVRAILDYEQAMDIANLERGPIKPYSEVKSDYEIHRYWVD